MLKGLPTIVPTASARPDCVKNGSNSNGLEFCLIGWLQSLDLVFGTSPPSPVPSFKQQQQQQIQQQQNSSSASTGAVPSSIATRPKAEDAGIAIDSKIEQAMDLVKTHLIYAVRDEIELLRRRIGDLETTVLNLEAENAVLRDHIPEEVLCALCLDTVPSSAAVKSPPKTLAFSQSAKATAI